VLGGIEGRARVFFSTNTPDTSNEFERDPRTSLLLLLQLMRKARDAVPTIIPLSDTIRFDSPHLKLEYEYKQGVSSEHDAYVERERLMR
jgi:hypothetical protein